MKNTNVRRITGVAILLAVLIVLQTIGNYLAPLGISVNLALIPIAVGALVYGPLAGAFLGLCNGAMVLAAPSTISTFYNYAPIGTVFTCLLKCTIAGLVSGLIFKLMKEKHLKTGAIISSVLIPVINTGLYVTFCLTIMRKAVEQWSTGGNIISGIFSIPLLINFVIELALMVALTPAIIKIYKIMTRTDKHAL